MDLLMSYRITLLRRSMKRFLLTPVCALLTLVSFTSCQKEDMNATDLARELTSELQKVTDYKSAQAAVPRVEAINKRYQDASVRLFALNDTALLKAAENSDQYVDSVLLLVKEIGRVRGSKPVTDYAGDIDRDEILMSIGQNQASERHGLSDADSLTSGTAYMKNDENKAHETPGTIDEYYGSTDLGEAIEYIASPTKFGIAAMDSDAPAAIPAAGADMEDEEITEDEEAPADEEVVEEEVTEEI